MGTVRETIEYPYIIIIGPSGAGKSTFCNFLSDISKLKIINCGDILVKTLEKNNIRVDKRSEIGRSYLNIFSEEDLSKDIYNYVEKNGCKIIDGVRLEKTLRYLIFKEPNAIIIFIESKENERKVRLAHRDIDEKQHMNLQIKETYDNMESLLKYSNYIIGNNNTICELKKAAENIWFDIINFNINSRNI